LTARVLAEDLSNDGCSDTSSSDDDTPAEVHPSFGHGFEFTFQAPLDHTVSADLPRTVTDINLKRPKGHPDGPTPASSPQKKRIRVPDTNCTPLPALFFPPSSGATSSASSDVFGSEADVTDGTDSTSGTLFSFWQREMPQDRAERNHRGFEELSTTRETRALTEERNKAMQKSRQRTQDRQRQQKHRAVVRNRMIASGWKPNQKRISLSSTL